MMFCWCALVLLTLVPVVTGNHAGVKVKLTQKGLDYVAVNAIKMIKQYKFPDITVSCNTFSGLRIQRWNKLDPVLKFDPTTGVTITIDSANLQMTGNWKFLLVRKGPVWLTLSKLDISVTAAVKTDEAGHLTLSIEKCDAKLGAFSGESWWDAALKSCLNLIHNKAEEMICPMMKTTIADYNPQLATLNAKLSEYSGIGFSMGPTVISKDSIEFSLKDIIFRTGQQEETHLSPTDFTLPSQNTKMLYIGISAFTIKSFITAYPENSFLSNIITDGMGNLVIGTDVQFQENA